MATVITTQPTNSTITDPYKIAQTSNLNSINAGDESIKTNGNMKENKQLLTDGVICEDMVHLNSVECDEGKIFKEEEERRIQELARNNNAGSQNCCCIYISDDYDNWFLLDCIVSCFRSIAIWY